EPARSGIAAVECGEDPKRLRIALETVIEVQQRPRHPVELLLAEVAERRMPELVSGRCRLHHHRIAPAEVADELTGAFVGVVQGDRDRPGHGRDLERMRQGTLDHRSGTGLRNELSYRCQT